MPTASVTKFANEKCRTISDDVSRLHYRILSWLNEYTDKGIAAGITADGAGNLVVDGSETDGRTPCLNSDILNLRAALLQVQTAIDTTAVPGVGSSAFAIVDKWQVNGGM